MTAGHQWGMVSETTQPMRYAMNFSTGQRYALTAPTLIGRNPHPGENEEHFNTVVIADSLRSVSKTHLLIAADAAGPYVMDRNSTNGTVVTLADGQQIICGPGQKVRFGLGTTIVFGSHWVSLGLQN